MPCYTPSPEESWAEHLEKMLCYACRILTKKQMLDCADNSGWQSLYSWYTEHILHDYIKNNSEEERDRFIKEAERLGLEIIEESFGISIQDKIQRNTS